MKTLPNDEDIGTLMKDRSLARIWLDLNVFGRKGVRDSKLLTIVLGAVAIANVGYLYFADADRLPEQIRFICLHGFKLTAGTLSFLLAGFVFLLNSSNADLLLTMFRRRHKTTQLDFLRYNTFSLLSLFAEYVFATIVFSGFLIFGQSHGLFSLVRQFVGSPIGDWVVKICFFIVSMLFLLIVIRLKSFITNVYHFAMTGLVLKFAEMETANETAEKQPDD